MLGNLRGAVREALNFGQRYQVLDDQSVEKLLQGKKDDAQIQNLTKTVPELAEFLSHNFMNSSLPGLDTQIVALLFNPVERAVLVIGDVSMMLLDIEGNTARTHVSQQFLVDLVKVTSAVGAAQAKVGGKGDKDAEITIKLTDGNQMELSIDSKSFPYITSLFFKITKFNQITAGHSLVNRIILLQKYLKGERLLPEY